MLVATSWPLKQIKTLLDLLFPIECLGCGQEGIWLCSACQNNLPLLLAQHCPACGAPAPFGAVCAICRPVLALDGAISCLPYAHPLIQTLIHVWKYQGITNLSPSLGAIVNRGLAAVRAQLSAEVKHLQQGLDIKALRGFPLLPTLLLRPDTSLIPVPLHKRKLRARGFNQASALADAIVNDRTDWNIAPVIERTRATAAQATLAGSDRHTNIKDAFILSCPPGDVAGKDFLLVDDVITTGSTCEAMARLLKNAGAGAVWALTIAYGHPGKS